jgi:hypothetical protein
MPRCAEQCKDCRWWGFHPLAESSAGGVRTPERVSTMTVSLLRSSLISTTAAGAGSRVARARTSICRPGSIVLQAAATAGCSSPVGIVER